MVLVGLIYRKKIIPENSVDWNKAKAAVFIIFLRFKRMQLHLKFLILDDVEIFIF